MSSWSTRTKARNSREAIILETPLGPEDALFDPGGVGSYFQTVAAVRKNLVEIEELIHDHPFRPG